VTFFESDEDDNNNNSNKNNKNNSTTVDTPSLPSSTIVISNSNNNYDNNNNENSKNNIPVVEEENKIVLSFIEKVKEIVRSEKDCLLLRLQGELNLSYYKSHLKYLLNLKYFKLKDCISPEYRRLISLTENDFGRKSKERIAIITYFCNNLIL
jgi:hypothetical protein